MRNPEESDVTAEEGPPVEVLPTEAIEHVFELSKIGAAASEPLRLRSFSNGTWVNDAGDDVGPGWDVPAGSSAVEAPLLMGTARPIYGIDAGLAKLGYTEDGVVLGVRSAIVGQDGGDGQHIWSVRPGLCYLHAGNRLQHLHAIGVHLGNPDHYVKVNADGVPVAEKGILKTPQQLGDRVRNFVEREVQFHAAGLVENGIVVLDGAATPDTWDTPPALMRKLSDAVTAGGNHLIAVSKKTMITVAGRELRYALSGSAPGPRYRYLNEILREERINAQKTGARADKRAFIGHLFAVRFAYTGETYRVDVVPAPGYDPVEALASFFASTPFRAGYPDVLVRAHLHSYFAYPDLIGLQAAAAAEFGFELRRDINLGPAFAPFGGRWK